MNPRQQRAAARRLTYRSRSVAVVVTLSAVALVAAWVGTEAVLAALGQPALLAAPATVVEAVRGQDWIAGVSAGALAVLGVVLVILALVPSRRGRRVLDDDRMVIVVDDAVLAGSLSRSAASAARVPAGQVSTALSRRSAHVSVEPTSGHPVSAESVAAAVDETVRAARPARTFVPRIDISTRGKVPA